MVAIEKRSGLLRGSNYNDKKYYNIRHKMLINDMLKRMGIMR